MVTVKRAWAIGSVIGAMAIAGCGSSSSSSSSSSTSASGTSSSSTAATTTSSTASTGSGPTVLAAASLTNVFPMIDPSAKYTFAGSDALEAQIEQGAPADVFAAASPKQPAALYAKGLVDKPVEFATNTLVLIVPKNNPAHIMSVNDITKPGVKLVICQASCRAATTRARRSRTSGSRAAAMKNVVSQTTDVTQAVADVALGPGRRRVRLHHRREGGRQAR